MGIEYYVVNKRDGTFFELGKGGWYALNEDRTAFSDAEYLAHEILTECYHRELWDDGWDELAAWVHNELAPKLHAFAAGATESDLVVISDVGDERQLIKALRYRCVGSRYGATPEEHAKAVAEQNEHLADTPENRRWQNPESYRDYPNFDDYNRGRV